MKLKGGVKKRCHQLALLLLIAALALLLALQTKPAAAQPEQRLAELRQEAAAELNAYYRGEGEWLRCWRLLREIESMESEVE